VTTISLIALLILFAASQISDHIFKIHNDNFYRPFHFAGGFFMTLLFFDFTKNYFLALFLAFVAGVLWEAYEWAEWRYVPRFHKKSRKPKVRDTRNDILDDLLGALTVGIILYVF